MKNLIISIDIGSTYIKGLLIERGHIIDSCSLEIKEDYLITYRSVIYNLRKNIPSNEEKNIKICFTGVRKRLIEKTFNSSFKCDIRSITSFSLKYFPNIKTVIDIGKTLKIINIRNNKIDNYLIDDINNYGNFIDKANKKLNINYDIDIHKNKVSFKNMNTYLFDYNYLDKLLDKYDKDEIMLGIYDLVIDNIIDNMIKIKASNNILLVGGLTLNKTFLKLFKLKVNNKIYTCNNGYIAAAYGVYLLETNEKVTNLE